MLARLRCWQTAKAFGEQVNAAGGKAEVFIYPDCGHGFLNVGQEVRSCTGRQGTG